ncbi:hypothetical protein WA1_27660 [Scytonema hofmannii PCC 7110]|uniref:DUF2281 domain-containing protein n=1 Tax=Scytonema hofmannii PCC 7110 TaxID=128403 RepID=A0A139X6J9_9CYAN|nr:DUF2281 domain-containing protein [Scytonema hofmannii]KYC40310.1 hypothetical protein WA1_27660 [Scytonema hofmannii PCC 7110]
MSEIINIERAILDNLRVLPNEQQQEVLNFIEFLVQKVRKIEPISNEDLNDSILSTIDQQEQLSMQEIAKLPVQERHKILAPYIALTSEDFIQDKELTEFSVLDSEDWDTENE